MMTDPATTSVLQLMQLEAVQTVVHDLRTPMTVIKGYLQLLLSGSVGEMSQEHKMLIERSVGPLDDLILMTENLLQVATLEKNSVKLSFAETDLDKLLAGAIEFYQLPFKQRDMRIFRNGNTLGLKLLVDAFWIKRVFHNLIWNAFKFTPDRGQVTLQVEERHNGIDIIIEDTGRGIPAEKLDAIFHKFQQAEVKDRKLGSGLGLWISKRVMELHGGTIRVESREGHGSRFILSFPFTLIL
jgi:signal transduction histidine kinase